MIVHDMRNLISGVSGNLELFEAQVGSQIPFEFMKPIANAQKSTRSMLTMTNSLLEISKLEGGKMPVEPEMHNPVGIVEKAVSDLGARAQNVSIKIQCPKDVTSWGDSALLWRVFQNLISNAADFVPKESGVIQIRFENLPDGSCRSIVADNGPGVPIEMRERIFEKFASGNHPDLDRHSAGLGLAFCQLAIESHGGQIGVDCPESGGSEFWFTLPAPVPVTQNMEPSSMVKVAA